MRRAKVRFIESCGNAIHVDRFEPRPQLPAMRPFASAHPYSSGAVKIPLTRPSIPRSVLHLLFLPVCEFFHHYGLSHDHGMGVVQP